MFDKKTIHGAYFAMSAYCFWGFVPIYFKFVAHVTSMEILFQRIVWSVVLLLAILDVTGKLNQLRISTDKLFILFISSLLLSANWLTFIYAIINDNIVETSLGYFITPLVSVFLGMVFLSENLRPLQWLAIILAAIGISVQLIYYGAIPWVSLALGFSFGFYGLVRKNLNLPSVAGLALETLIISPIVLAGLFWIYLNGDMKFGKVDIQTDILLILGGFITSFPLLCFAAAVTRLSLTAIGMFQYIAPSLSLVLAVLYYGEPFGTDRIITFSFIWLALILFAIESFYFHRRLGIEQ